jgi:hypothetical protein
LLLEFLDRAFDMASWHGPSLANSFRGLDAPLAARALPGRKSIWQQVLHAAYWKRIVLNKLVGTEKFPRRGSNWPAVPEQISRRAWKDDVQLLHEIHARLRAAVASMDPHRLKDPKLRQMIQGISFHDIYHAGQIRLLRKLMEGKSSHPPTSPAAQPGRQAAARRRKPIDAGS